MSILNSDYDVDKLGEILKRRIRIHFIGILGSGMLPLARLARSLGYAVSGSDLRADGSHLQDADIEIKPHDVRNTAGVDLGVYSLAIDGDNVELAALEGRGVPVISRAQLLGALMRSYRYRIGVSGSHGKSTTVAAIDRIFTLAGVSPTTVSGATLSDGSTEHIGDADVFIYEACEYKDSFLRFFPTLAVITCVELDHTDYFTSTEHICASFQKCAERSTDAVLLNADCPRARAIGDSLHCAVYTYGQSHDATYRYEMLDRSGGFAVYKRGEPYLTLRTGLLGDFNISNLTAAIAAADVFGVEKRYIAEGVRTFPGIARRMQLLCELDGRPVLYDYAHHPSEICSTLDAIKARYGECTVVFRPHTYSRTKSLWNEFIAALSKADFTILVDIYPAREKCIDGVTSEMLAADIGGSACCLPFSSVAEHVLGATRGAVILMGAGEIDEIVNDFLHKAKES